MGRGEGTGRGGVTYCSKAVSCKAEINDIFGKYIFALALREEELALVTSISEDCTILVKSEMFEANV